MRLACAILIFITFFSIAYADDFYAGGGNHIPGAVLIFEGDQGHYAPIIYDICQDQNSDLIIAGATYSPRMGFLINAAPYISKYLKSGDLIWEKKNWKLHGVVNYAEIVLDRSGNIILIGTVLHYSEVPATGALAEITDTAIEYNNEILIKKFDPDGNVLWEHLLGGIGFSNAGSGITVDDRGYIFASGSFEGTVDLDPGPGIEERKSVGHSDMFLLCLNPDGGFVWVRTLGGRAGDKIIDVSLNPDGNLIVGGYLNEIAFFDVTPDMLPDNEITPLPNPDIRPPQTIKWGVTRVDPGTGEIIFQDLELGSSFIGSFNTDGDFLWSRTWGAGLNDIIVDLAGNIFVRGQFSRIQGIDCGLGLIPDREPGEGYFLIKFDPDGDMIRALTWDSFLAQDFAVDTGGSIFIAGKLEGTADMDPGPGTELREASGLSDMFVTGIDPDGQFQWVFIYGGDGDVPGERASGIMVTNDDTLLVTGTIKGDLEYDSDNNVISCIGNEPRTVVFELTKDGDPVI